MSRLGRHLRAAATAVGDVLGNRQIARLEGGWMASVAADWTFLVIVLVVAYRVGGAAAVGGVGVVRMLVAMVAAPIAAGLVGRFRPGHLLVAGPLLRAAAIGLAALAVAAGVPPVVLLGAIAVEAAGASIVRPVQMAVLPQLARSPSELIAANVVSSTAEGVGTFVGPAIGGLAVGAAGPVTGSAIAAALLLAEALVVFPIRVDAAAQVVEQPMRAAGRSLLAGARLLRRRAEPRALVLAFGAQVVVRGILGVLLVSAAIDLLALGDPGVGLLNSAMGVGGFLGALGALSLVQRRRLAGPFLVALVGWGVPIALIGLVSAPVLAVCALAVIGASNAVLDVSGLTLLQRVVRHDDRAAVFGLLEGQVGAGVALGSLLGPVLVDVLGLHTALLVTGAILPATALAGWSALRHADDAAVVPDRQLAVLRGVPMFAALPLTTLEIIASRLAVVHFEPGAPLTREGEPGDRFYVIEDGEVEVEVGGRTIRRLGPGDALGEIALLRSIPRTATVRAAAPTTAWGLDGAVFIAAVTSRPDSLAAAEAVMAQRLAPSASVGGAVGVG